MAKKYKLNQRTYGQGTGYDFPPHWSNGWIVEACPADGLFVSSAWFTPDRKMVHTVDVKKPCLWILCIDSGQLIYSRQGKPAVSLPPTIQVINNPQRPFHLTFPKGIHACFTSVLVFDDFIQPFLQTNKNPAKISIEDAKLWEEEHYNTSNIMLILEQIRWALRNADMPLLAFEGMALHLLCAIARNYPAIPKRRSNRRNYVTWENEQRIYQVKVKIDENILDVPPMEEMLKIAGMSESKLRLSFKNTYHIPLYDYIRREKMKRAMQLLSADHLSIRDISEQCGYKNAAKFAAAFHDVHGMTPSEFRKAFHL